jgi:hypothetical protein
LLAPHLMVVAAFVERWMLLPHTFIAHLHLRITRCEGSAIGL